MDNTWIVGAFIFGYFLIVILIFVLSMNAIDQDLRNRQQDRGRMRTESATVRLPEMIREENDLPEASPLFVPSFYRRKTLLMLSNVSRENDGESK